MKMKSMRILSAITIALGVLGTNLYAQGTDSRIGSIARQRQEKQAIAATALTKAEAEKKYPPKSGTYPPGTRDAHDPSGVVSSPYPPHEKYNCSKVNHGGLVLDVRAKQVFVYP
jgi:hypothetical protein